MGIKMILEDLKREFIENRINKKTGWGKNEIKEQFDEAVSTVLIKLVDK